MPSGAKKRKALKKKKKEQESIGISHGNDNGDNLHGNDDPASQDEKESDGNLSSPGSQGNGEAGKRDPSALSKDIVKEKVETSVVDSVKPEVVISEKNEQVETSANSDSVELKSSEEENLLHRVKKDKDGNGEEDKTIKFEIQESSEEKHLLASGPPVARSSWLSCCGLFEVMTGSER